MSPAIEKQQFRNESGGWIGVVLIGPKGDEQGHAVEPGQTVWLSEAEQILTANAPRRPEDNPFIAQTVSRTNPTTGELEQSSVTPLVPASEDRFVPANARPIPADIYGSPFGAPQQHEGGLQAQGNIGTNEPTSVTASGDPVAEKEDEVTENQDPPPAPPRAAAAATAAEATGAAEPPASAPAEGSFAPGEEVATPDAPGASAGSPDTDTSTPPFPPAAQAAPWTPQNDPAKVTPPPDEE